MKKFFVLFLSLLFVLSFVACGNDEEGGDAGSTSTSSSTDTAKAEFQEVTLFDDDNCTMIVKGFEIDDIWGFTLNVFLENKTDKTLMFGVEDASVNGYMHDPFWASEVAAGKKENTEIQWDLEALEEDGIEKVENIEMKIHVFDSDNYDMDYFVDDTYSLEIPAY